MWRRYRAMSGASSLSGPSRDTELFVHFIWKKKKKVPEAHRPSPRGGREIPPISDSSWIRVSFGWRL